MGPLSLPRKVSVLGSTGSIGVSTLDLFERAKAEVEVIALTAGRNVERLAEQARTAGRVGNPGRRRRGCGRRGGGYGRPVGDVGRRRLRGPGADARGGE